MSQVLINTVNRNGLYEGSPVHVVQPTGRYGRLETPGNGFVSLQLPELSTEEASAALLKSTEVHSRSVQVELGSMPIPVHPAISRQAKSIGLSAGRKLLDHLNKGYVLPSRLNQIPKKELP